VMQSMLGGVSADAEEPVLGVLHLYLAGLGAKS
jgi:hypothetical protein